MKYLNEEQVLRIKNRAKHGFRILTEYGEASGQTAAGNPYMQAKDFVDDDVDIEQEYPEPEIQDADDIITVLKGAIDVYKESDEGSDKGEEYIEKLEKYMKELAEKYEKKKGDDEDKEVKNKKEDKWTNQRNLL